MQLASQVSGLQISHSLSRLSSALVRFLQPLSLGAVVVRG